MRTKRKSRILACTMAGCLSPGIGLIGVQSTEAATKEFIGNTTGINQTQWNYAINWNAAGIPAAGDTVEIGYLPDLITPADVLASGTAANTIGNLDMTDGSTLLLNNYFDLEVTDTTTINSSTLDISRWGTLTTDKLEIEGSGIIELNKGLVIGTSATIDTNGSIVVGYADDRTIHLSGGTATFVNDGKLEVDFDLTMSAVSGGTYSLGGSGAGKVNVAANKALTITAPMTGNAFNGIMTLGNNAAFSSVSAWNSSGDIDAHGDATISGGPLTLSGAATLDVLTQTGSCIGCTGVSDVTITSDLIVNDTAQINVTGSHTLTLIGETTFDDGTLSVVSGALTIDGDAVFEPDSSLELGTTGHVDFIVGSNGDVTINQSTFDWTDTNQTVASGGTLTINTDEFVGVGLERSSTIGGTLNVNPLTDQLDKWKLSTRLEFEEGTALARTSPIINGVELEVIGTLFGRLEANPYSDVVINAPLNIRGGSNGSPTGGITVSNEATMTLNNVTEIQTFSNQLINGNGVLTISGPTKINNAVFFRGTGTLVIAENNTVEVGGNQVALVVDVTNNGTLDLIGTTVKTLEIGDSVNDRTYTQSEYGTLILTIDGSDNDIDNYDNIDIYGDAVLDGELEIDDSAYTMAAGDTYTIIDIVSAGGTITGTFDTVDGLPTYSSLNTEMSGLFYNSTSVDILTVIAGDLDGDGFVGIDDLNLVLDNFNTGVPVLSFNQGDANGDAYVGIDDLNAVLNNWNNGTPPSVSSMIPEPASFSLLSLGGLAMLRRTRD